MRYKEELYIGSGLYESSGIDNHEENLATCRKEHQCSRCQGMILSGNKAVRETGFLDDRPVSNYICIPCIESWLIFTGVGEEGLNQS